MTILVGSAGYSFKILCEIDKPFGCGTRTPIPDYQTLMLPLLKRAAVGATRVLEAEKQIGEEFGLTPEKREQLLPSGKQRILHNRAHWAKFYLMKAGLVTFPSRGTFVATDAGRELLARNPSRIAIDLLRQYPSFEEFYRGNHGIDSEQPGSGTAAVVPSASPMAPPSTPEAWWGWSNLQSSGSEAAIGSCLSCKQPAEVLDKGRIA